LACSRPARRPPARHLSSNARPLPPFRTIVLSRPLPPKNTAPNHAAATVRRGDTLQRIASEHGQSLRDLVSWNNLNDANDIKVGQVLRLTPPATVVERSPGVTTSPITMPPSDTRTASVPVAKKPAPTLSTTPPPVRNPGDVPETRTLDPVVPPVATGVAPVTKPAPAADEERVSWIWPSDGKVIGTFEEGKNKGIDIAGKPGQRVMAAGAGKVMYAGSGIRGYGNLVIVKHSNNVLSAYAHNRAILVKEGESVVKGQTIAEMGNSDSDTVKLHFEIRQQGKPVDPSRFLPSR
jgi:lipoprotein NlpD